MFLQHVWARRAFPFLRSTLILRTQCLRNASPLRASVLSRPTYSSVAVPKASSKKTLYPERLIIYHAGTARTVFVGCLKVTTIFICAFFSMVVAPTHFYAEGEPLWVAGAVLLSGIIPLVVVSYISGPFVNYIHLRLPLFARHDREMLLRYSKSLTKSAEVDITTMNFIGKPRVSRMKVADLTPVKERLGMVNYVRNTQSLKKPWRAVRQFGVHSGRSKVMGGDLWKNVQVVIEKNQRS